MLIMLTLHNDLYDEVFKILSVKFYNIYNIVDIWKTVMRALTIQKLKLVIANVIPVSLHLEIDITDYEEFINPNIFLPEISFTNMVHYSESFLT